MNQPCITDPLRLSKRLFSEKEAAQYLGRSLWAVREMRHKGKLPFIQDGRRILFDILDLNAWIQDSKTRAAS
jgi:excisionase family DNA binding protein